ncbi:hypothetical protein AZF08_15685 [Bacillus gaemokensis]|nr:hypothetical protein AZF08_15685 [Bacillus gaemokensis]
MDKNKLMIVFASMAKSVPPRTKAAINLIPRHSYPPIKKILISIVRILNTTRDIPTFFSNFFSGNKVLNIKNTKSIRNAIAINRITILQKSLISHLLLFYIYSEC